MTRKAIALLLSVLALQLSACFDEPFVADTTFAFQQAIEQNQPREAFTLLAEDIQNQLDETNFTQAAAASTEDLSPVIALFRQNNLNEIPRRAGIERLVFNNLRGYRGTITIAVVQEGEEWKVVNILLDTLYVDSSHPSAFPTATPDPNGIYPEGYNANLQESRAADQVGNSFLADFARQLRYPAEGYEQYIYPTLTQAIRDTIDAEQLFELAQAPGSDLQPLVDILREAEVSVDPDLPQQIIIYNLCARREYTCGERLFQFTMIKESDGWLIGNIEAVDEVPVAE